MKRVGVIGGTGLADLPLKQAEPIVRGVVPGVKDRTDYTLPDLTEIEIGKAGNLKGVETVFVHRHAGDLPAHLVDHKQNIRVMKDYQVDAVIAVTACGSLNRRFPPGEFVLPNDFVDLTANHETFIQHPSHPSSIDPYDKTIRRCVEQAFHVERVHIHPNPDAIMVSIRGPRFASAAESAYYQNQGWDLVNMTTAPETTLAREIGIPYVLLAYVTDYDTCALEPGEEHTSYDLVKERFTGAAETLLKVLPTAVHSIACTR